VGSVTVAFDGIRWLVGVTTLAGGGLYDLFGIRVATDGTVLDPTPQLLAAGLTDAAPEIAGRPGGGFAVAVVRPAGVGLLGVDVLTVP
jgi:hypothetical protein